MSNVEAGVTGLPVPADFGIEVTSGGPLTTTSPICDRCGWHGPAMVWDDYGQDHESLRAAARVLFDAHDCLPPPPPKILAEIKLSERSDGTFDLYAKCPWPGKSWEEEGEMGYGAEEVKLEHLLTKVAGLLDHVLENAGLEDLPDFSGQLWWLELCAQRSDELAERVKDLEHVLENERTARESIDPDLQDPLATAPSSRARPASPAPSSRPPAAATPASTFNLYGSYQHVRENFDELVQ